MAEAGETAVECAAARREELPPHSWGQTLAVRIPSTSTRIDYRAFETCTSIVSVHIPATVDVIGSSAFVSCVHLATVTIEPGLLVVAGFSKCDSLTTINLPFGVKTIEDATFANCRSLRSVHLPATLTSIGKWAFAQCPQLGEIVIPPSVSFIGFGAFDGCTGLTSVTVQSLRGRIQPNAFRWCPWLVVVTTQHRLRIENSAFENCTRLQCVIAPDPFEKSARALDRFFRNTPVNRDNPPHADTPAARAMAAALRYWSRSTHHLCAPPRREWVVGVMLVAGWLRARYGHHGAVPALPEEMWVEILGLVPRHLMGTRAV